jgi:hypothetical protein
MTSKREFLPLYLTLDRSNYKARSITLLPTFIFSIRLPLNPVLPSCDCFLVYPLKICEDLEATAATDSIRGGRHGIGNGGGRRRSAPYRDCAQLQSTMTTAGTPAGNATAPNAGLKAAKKNDWQLYTGKEVKIRGVEASSIWMEISSEKKIFV